MMGDFNVKIGIDNIGYEGIMGIYGLGQMNENGECFVDLCVLNQLVIGGSIFLYKLYGDFQIIEWKIRLIIFVLVGSLGGYGEMCE